MHALKLNTKFWMTCLQNAINKGFEVTFIVCFGRLIKGKDNVWNLNIFNYCTI